MDPEKLFVVICGLLNSSKHSVCVFKKRTLRRKIIKLYALYKIAEKNEE